MGAQKSKNETISVGPFLWEAGYDYKKTEMGENCFVFSVTFSRQGINRIWLPILLVVS